MLKKFLFKYVEFCSSWKGSLFITITEAILALRYALRGNWELTLITIAISGIWGLITKTEYNKEH